MKRPRFRLHVMGSLTLIVVLFCATVVSAQIGREYTFGTSSSTYTSVTTGNEVISGTTSSTYGTFDESRTAGPFSIGFDFVFNCTTYTQFTVGTSGYMILGTTTYGSVNNSLDGSGAYPLIAPFWDQLHMYDGGCSPSIDPDVGVYYQMTGSAPNRVLTVEWRVQFNSGGTYYWYNCTNGPLLRFKAMLYEGTNRIEFQYGPLYQGLALSGSIGIAAASNNFYSVSPGTSASASSTTANNAVNLAVTGIANGTIYQFTPNKLVLDGRTGAGNEGVANLQNGSILLSNVNDNIGQSNVYTPVNMKKSCAIATLPVQMTITGTDASSYTFSATGTQTYNTSITTATGIAPGIRFTPLHGETHYATLTVTNPVTGAATSYELQARAAPRIRWIGNVSQGGTANVRDGDTLINGIQVLFGTSMSWSPLTLENIISPGIAPPATITYTLNDPTGNYSINRTTDAIDGGQRSTPLITFNAVGRVGYQEAVLTVSVDGEKRSYLLRAFAAAPGGEIRIKGVAIDSNSRVFINSVACVGDGSTAFDVVAANTGAGDFVVHGFRAFATDTVIAPGTPPYPLLRDQSGQPIPIQDYYITTLPAGSPRPAPGTPFEMVIPEGQSRTFRIVLSPSFPGRRYGKIYFITNGYNLNERDVYGTRTQGLVSANVFGQGVGAEIAGSPDAGLPKQIAFTRTEVRETSTKTAWLYNDGVCDLRINKDKFRIESGDVGEFKLLSVLPNTPVIGDDYLLAPGTGDSVVVSFTPQTYGSRVATIRLVTNDSTLGGDGVIERGTYYWDLFGVGNIGLEARDLLLGPAVIGGESSSGYVLLENTSAAPIVIDSIGINGGNGDIVRDPSHVWPNLPITLQPGEQIKIWVALSPDAAGAAGDRNGTVDIHIAGGDVARAKVRGYAGTRTAAVTPTSLFSGTKISVGELSRAFVAITNTGTVPVRLVNMQLAGANPANYAVGPIVRATVQPGGTEFFEVTYAPKTQGTSSATLTIVTNSINGTPAGSHTITLGGEAASTIPVGGGSQRTEPVGSPAGRTSLSSGTWSARLESGTALSQASPNPSSDRVDIRYWLPASQQISLDLYNSRGEVVRTLERGMMDEGNHMATVSLADLASGVYYYVLSSEEGTLTLSVRVVH